MRIPKVSEVVSFEHKGKVRHAVVEDVRPERGSIWRLWVLPFEDVFSNGDGITWTTEQGKRVLTFVLELEQVDEGSKFAVVAGEDW